MSSDKMRGLSALGRLSSLNSMHRSFNAPLSTEFLNQPSIPPNMTRSQMEAPPLPPRPDQSMGSAYMRSPMRSYYNPYSPFSSNMLSPYRGYGNYSRFGSPHDPYNSFIQLAEESSRPTFETIESVVQVFSSISMMLESTYQAVYSSYSAILGVVDQFSRLKDHVAQILSFLTLLRGLRWLCLKVLYILRIRKQNPSVEAAWISAESTNNSLSDFNKGPQQSSWPFFMFIGLVVGAPWIMFKLLAKSVEKSIDPKQWIGEDGVRYTGQAIHNFKATRPKELSFNTGEVLKLSPASFNRHKPQNWLLACNEANETGLVPCNYLRFMVLKPVNREKNNPVKVVPTPPTNEHLSKPNDSLPVDTNLVETVPTSSDQSVPNPDIPAIDMSAVNIPDELLQNNSVPLNEPKEVETSESLKTENT